MAEPSEVPDTDPFGPSSETESPADRGAVRTGRRFGWRTVVRRIGQALLLAGALLLLFVAYQLWGTTFWTQRAQSRLRNDFRAKLAVTAPSAPSSPEAPPQPPPDARLAPAEGEALARLVISRIELDVIVVEGVDPEALRDGPGHFPGTPLPGEDGNVVLSGHRTTYGAPFHHLEELAEGDELIVQSPSGEFVYRVAWSRIVAPSEVSVTESTPGVKEVTLTTCHPKFSASQRLVVRATQVGDARPLSRNL